MPNLTIVCISDTHEQHDNLVLPEGDLLIHAGDFTLSGEINKLAQFAQWFAEKSQRYRLGGVCVAGNHDLSLDPIHPFITSNPSLYSLARTIMTRPEFVYLEDSGVTLGGLRIWGSPQTPAFNGWAFNVPRGEDIAAYWKRIPSDTQILITHGPARGILDFEAGTHLGCEELLSEYSRICPLLHVTGHIHQSYGIHQNNAAQGGTVVVNAAVTEIVREKRIMENEVEITFHPYRVTRHPFVASLPTSLFKE